MSALERYKHLGVDDDEQDPIERLRAFCSLSMQADDGQDWVDCEPFFTAIIKQRDELERELADARARFSELEHTFQLRWNADRRAIKRWQAEQTGRELTWPDHADMVVWLLEQCAAVTAERDDVKASLANRDRVLREWPAKMHALMDDLDNTRRERDAARAEVEALREDAERYRLVRNPSNYIRLSPTFVWNEAAGRYDWMPEKLDAAIDAARKDK